MGRGSCVCGSVHFLERVLADVVDVVAAVVVVVWSVVDLSPYCGAALRCFPNVD